ncbi:hypothetical protein ACET3Z_013155 [Daucus carota]
MKKVPSECEPCDAKIFIDTWKRDAKREYKISTEKIEKKIETITTRLSTGDAASDELGAKHGPNWLKGRCVKPANMSNSNAPTEAYVKDLTTKIKEGFAAELEEKVKQVESEFQDKVKQVEAGVDQKISQTWFTREQFEDFKTSLIKVFRDEHEYQMEASEHNTEDERRSDSGILELIKKTCVNFVGSKDTMNVVRNLTTTTDYASCTSKKRKSNEAANEHYPVVHEGEHKLVNLEQRINMKLSPALFCDMIQNLTLSQKEWYNDSMRGPGISAKSTVDEYDWDTIEKNTFAGKEWNTTGMHQNQNTSIVKEWNKPDKLVSDNVDNEINFLFLCRAKTQIMEPKIC